MCVCVCVCVRACSVAQSCPTLLQPHGLYSPLGSSVHGLFQARILEWVAISSFRRSSRLRNRTLISFVSCIGRWILYHLPPLLTIITYLALSLTNIFSVIEWRDFPTGDSHLQEALANGTWHAVGTCSLFVRQVLHFVHTQIRSLVRVYSVVCIPVPQHLLDCGLRLPNLASWLWPSVQPTQKHDLRHEHSHHEFIIQPDSVLSRFPCAIP